MAGIAGNELARGWRDAGMRVLDPRKIEPSQLAIRKQLKKNEWSVCEREGAGGIDQGGGLWRGRALGKWGGA